MWVSPTVCGIETPPVSTFSPLVWEFRSVRSRPNPLPPRSLSADHIVRVGQYKLRKPSSTSREVRPRTGRDRRQRRRTGPPRVLHRSETASRPLRSVRRASRGSGGTPRVHRVALEGGYNVDGPTRPVDRARRRPRGRRRSRNRRRRGEHGTDSAGETRGIWRRRDTWYLAPARHVVAIRRRRGAISPASPVGHDPASGLTMTDGRWPR